MCQVFVLMTLWNCELLLLVATLTVEWNLLVCIAATSGAMPASGSSGTHDPVQDTWCVLQTAEMRVSVLAHFCAAVQ